MSPLAGFLLRIMRGASLAAAGFMLLVIGIEFWKRWNFGGFAKMTTPDISFMAILFVMLIAFLWLARSIAKEIKKHGT